MNRKGIFGLVMIVLLLGAMGCRREPRTADDLVIRPATVEPTPQDIASPPDPSLLDDQRPRALAGDLQEATTYARDQGLLGDVFFEFDSFVLAGEARERLARNARFLMDHPEFVVTIEGHCDERGTSAYNLALGERRANAAREYLGSLGVSDDRMRTVSYGKERPFCTQSSESCWAQNRRAHFIITGRTFVG
jgi:peptidoglycan-associated lipoprotein